MHKKEFQVAQSTDIRFLKHPPKGGFFREEDTSGMAINYEPTETMKSEIDINNSVTYGVYAASLDSSRWHTTISEICNELGATTGFYGGLDMRSGRGAYWYAHGISLDVQRIYNEKYVGIDPTLRSIMRAPGIAKVFNAAEHAHHPEYRDFFQEFMLPNGLGSVLSAIVSKRGSLFSLFGFQRKLGMPAFSRRDRDALQALIPHLEQADRIASSLAVMEESRRLAMAVMDRIDHGVIFLNEKGDIRLTNKKAESLLEAGEILIAELGKLSLTSPYEDIRFRDKLREIASGSSTAGYMVVKCSQGSSKATIAILPLNAAEETFAVGRDIRAVIYISTNEAPQANAAQFLVEAFGLTMAEVKVLSELANGKRTEEIATSLSISLSTVKTHIQHLFQKTGVNRQTDLVRIYYGLPAVI